MKIDLFSRAHITFYDDNRISFVHSAMQMFARGSHFPFSNQSSVANEYFSTWMNVENTDLNKCT